MSPRRPSAGITAWAAIVVLWGGAFSLACRLVPQAGRAAGGSSGLVGMLLVGSQAAISGNLFHEADLFFHRGVDLSSLHVSRTSIFDRISGEIAPMVHVHREGGDVREIMPWLRMATRVNPHNVTAYGVAAFWMTDEIRRPDLAEQILLEAERNNPHDYRVQLDMARLYLRQRRMEDAARVLKLGLVMWPSGLDTQDEQTRLDKANLLLFQALLCEMKNDRAGAMTAFQGILELFPDRQAVRDRMAELDRSASPPLMASRMLQSMMERQAEILEEAEHGPGETHHR